MSPTIPSILCTSSAFVSLNKHDGLLSVLLSDCQPRRFWIANRDKTKVAKSHISRRIIAGRRLESFNRMMWLAMNIRVHVLEYDVTVNEMINCTVYLGRHNMGL